MSTTSTSACISRRGFLGAAGMGLAAPLLLPAQARGANAQITLGVIGTGSRGEQVMMEGFANDRDVRVLAVCDVQQARREKAAAHVNERYGNTDCVAYNDFRDILNRDDIDAVLIAAPDHWHGVMATHAAEAGKDMYCEKPLGVALHEGQAIRDAVRRNNVIFQTGTQQRSGGDFRRACELALSGCLGRIHTVEVGAPGPGFEPKYAGALGEQPMPPGLDWDLYVGPAPMSPFNPGRLAWPDWYLISDYCLGFILNWGIHHLDIALWGCPRLMTQPFTVECEADYRNQGLTDNINGWRAEFTYPDGLRLKYSSTGNPYPQGCRFIGDEGWVHVSRREIITEPASLLDAPLPDDAPRLPVSSHHARNFVEAIKNRTDPISPVEAAFRAETLGVLGDIAARLQRKLAWNPDTEGFTDDPEAEAMLSRPLRAPWALATGNA